MIVFDGIRVNSFYVLVEELCFLAGIPYRRSLFSKKMYGNIVLTFLTAYREKLNVSYRRFVEICSENNIQRMLCIKRIPHFTTLQKFVQRTPKALFEKLVKACRTLLGLRNVEASIDGTGFSNTNPSHYYMRESAKQERPVEVKNYTKTLFLADNKTKLILNVKTFSDNTSEMTQLKPMVSEIANALKTLIADKGYDSASNRKHCISYGIKPVIPVRQYARTRAQTREPSKRYKQQLDKQTYNRRALIESVNSAIKRTLGSYVCSRRADNQQKQVTLKAIAYNIEHIGRTIKIRLFIYR